MDLQSEGAAPPGAGQQELHAVRVTALAAGRAEITPGRCKAHQHVCARAAPGQFHGLFHKHHQSLLVRYFRPAHPASLRTCSCTTANRNGRVCDRNTLVSERRGGLPPSHQAVQLAAGALRARKLPAVVGIGLKSVFRFAKVRPSALCSAPVC